MAISAIMGLPGAGKSYVAVNRFIFDILRNTDRHIYTNLPFDGIELERFLVRLTRSAARRWWYRSRIHFLPASEGEGACRVEFLQGTDGRWRCVGLDRKTPDADDEGRDMLKEAYLFTRPNSVTFLDEVADIYNTQDRSHRPKELLSYINHHRHYKDDLYFFLQDISEIDPGIRKKIQFLYVVTNSTKTNMFDWWALKGLRWPVQFFRVRMLLGPRMRTGDPYRLSEVSPDESYSVWPTSGGFKCYRSFSQSGKIKGKAEASSEAQSGDLEKGLWPKIAHFLSMSSGAVGMLGAVCMAAYLGVNGLYSLANVSSADIARASGQSVASRSVNTNAAAAASGGPASAADVKGQEGPELLRLVTPGAFVTSKGRYAVGSLVGSNRVVRVFLDGVEVEGGGRLSWHKLLGGGGASPAPVLL